MTNEEMQRTMEFIVAHQAQFAASMQRLDEERVRDAPRLARLEESSLRLEQSFQLLVQLAETTDARLDELESRVPRLEESYQLLVRLVETADARLNQLELPVQE